EAAEDRGGARRWSAEGVPGRVWELVARPRRGGLRDLYRHVLTPWYWALPAAGAIGVQEALVAANGWGGPASLGVVAAGALATANAAPAWLRTQTAAKRHPHAAQWAALEPGHTRVVATAAAGLGVMTAAASRYWQYHRHHTVVLNARAARAARLAALRQAKQAAAGEETTGVAADPDELVRRLTERWPAFVAASGKALPGTRLTDITRTDYGATAVLHLEPGAQERSTVTAALGRVASGLKLAPSALSVEDIDPEPGQEPDSSILRLRLVSQATAERPVPLDDGRPRVLRRGSDVLVRLGEYIDGQGEPT